MASAVQAMVQEGVKKLALRDFPRPEIGPDAGLVRVEACGLCGTDYEQYEGAFPRLPLPFIPGHEPVGIIEHIGEVAAKRWRVAEGDRVAVEPALPCGHCRACRGGTYMRCRGNGPLSGYSFVSSKTPPGLYGGYAEYLYLPGNAIVHKISPDIPPEVAVMFNPLGAGIRWAHQIPGLGMGDTIVILGPGQRGLMSVIAAREAGAKTIIVTGLDQDRHKLDLAKKFGADITVNVEKDNLRGIVQEATGKAGADVVVEVTSYATQPVADALFLVRPGGCVVLAGMKGFKPIPNFISDIVVAKEIQIVGALGVMADAYIPAIEIIESQKYPLDLMHTHTFPLAEAEQAILTLSGKIENARAVHVSIHPHT